MIIPHQIFASHYWSLPFCCHLKHFLSSTRIEGTLELLFVLRCVGAALRAWNGRRTAQSSLWITLWVLVPLVLWDGAACPAHLQRALGKSSFPFRSHWPAWQSFSNPCLWGWNEMPCCQCIPVVQYARIWFLWVAENEAWYWEPYEFIFSFNGIVFLPLCIKKTHAHERGRFYWLLGLESYQSSGNFLYWLLFNWLETTPFFFPDYVRLVLCEHCMAFFLLTNSRYLCCWRFSLVCPALLSFGCSFPVPWCLWRFCFQPCSTDSLWWPFLFIAGSGCLEHESVFPAILVLRLPSAEW